MTKEEALKVLTDAEVSLELTKAGDFTANQLELMAKGVQADKTIADLNKRLIDAEEGSGSGAKRHPRFKVDGKTVELVIPESIIRLEGERRKVNATTLKEDKALLAHLVKIQAGCLRIFEPKKS